MTSPMAVKTSFAAHVAAAMLIKSQHGEESTVPHSQGTPCPEVRSVIRNYEDIDKASEADATLRSSQR
jgi:hypothetical protein